MNETIVDYLHNPFFHTFLSASFAVYLAQKGSKTGSTSQPFNEKTEAFQRLKEDIAARSPREIHHHHHSKGSNDDDAGGVVILLLIASVASIWGFVSYLPEITNFMRIFLLSASVGVGVFFVVSFFLAGLSPRWLFECVLVMAFLIGALYLSQLPLKTITLEQALIAKEYKAVEYWLALSDWGRKIITSQLIGYVLFTLVVVIAIVRSIHLISFAILHANSSQFILKLALRTQASISWFQTIMLTILFAISAISIIQGANPNSEYWYYVDKVWPNFRLPK